MADLTTLAALPSTVYAGDSLLFSVVVADYAPSSWTLSYFFRQKQGSVIDLTSAAGSNNDHLFNVAASETAQWLPGSYVGVARVGDGTNFRTIGEARLEVLPQLSQQEADYDARTHAEKCLDAIEAVMEGRSTRDVLNTVIAGQSVSRLTPEQLILWRNYYRSEVANERAALDAQNGSATGRNILMRFNN